MEGSTHEPFDPALVQREMRIIRNDLHCSAMRITGGNLDRLEIAAAHAVAADLEVWFSPFTNDLTTVELLSVLADCAGCAERLRQTGAEVVLLTGSELGLFTIEVLSCAMLRERFALLVAPDPEHLREHITDVPGSVRYHAPMSRAWIHTRRWLDTILALIRTTHARRFPCLPAVPSRPRATHSRC